MGGDGQLFLQIGLVIVMASVLSLAFARIRQPMIIAYMIAGLLIGPGVLGWVAPGGIFEGLAQVGVAFLLFLVGVKLDWRQMKEVGPVAIATGLVEVIVGSVAGYFIAQAFGFDLWTSIFLGIAFSFASTVVVVKLLADKEELDRLHGRMSVGILIVQDVIAMVLLLALSAFGDRVNVGELLVVSLFKGALVLLALFIVAHWLLRPLMKYAARSQELLFLTSVGWCFAVASALVFLGFSIEIGALLAGIALAGTTPHREIEPKVRPLRDFFLIMFFIVLGTHMTFSSLSDQWQPVVAFSTWVLLGNPLVILLILRALGYHPRAGFLAGTSLAQISEFSFILIAGSVAVGLVDASAVSLVAFVGVVTIAISSYFITYNDQVYQAMSWAFEWMAPQRFLERKPEAHTADVLLFGYRDMGRAVLPAIRRLTNCFLVVDYDPTQVDALTHDDVPVLYGDVASDELLSDVCAEKAKLIVSTIPDVEVNTQVIRYMKRRRARSTVIVTAKSGTDAAKLYKAGATFVIVPSVLGGELFAELLKKKKTQKRLWQAAANG